MNSAEHWDTIYSSKETDELSWTQSFPSSSFEFIRKINLPKNAKIIDVGGGDSRLVDFLLEEGYENITVLDISEKALSRARKRVGIKGKDVVWIVSDIKDLIGGDMFDFWHDRAAFHFMTSTEQINHYTEKVREYLKPGGHVFLGTFSKQGPASCSGLPIMQYSELTLQECLGSQFTQVDCRKVDHTTPSGMVQNFLFCGFRKLPSH